MTPSPRTGRRPVRPLRRLTPVGSSAVALLLVALACGPEQPRADAAARRPEGDAAPPPSAPIVADQQPATGGGAPPGPPAAPGGEMASADAADEMSADLRLGLPVALENHLQGLRRVLEEMQAAPSPPALLPELDALVLRLQELQRRAEQGEKLEEIVPPDVRQALQADLADFPKAWLAPDESGRLPGHSLPLPGRRPQRH